MTGMHIVVESKPPVAGDDAILRIIEVLEKQLIAMDEIGLGLAAAHLDSTIQRLRADAIIHRNLAES